ncbi:MAG: glycosyltransferase family 4 protein [Thermoplasmatales archaeon]|nr:MAG: glycosyltransferase family 4 protein [Thermoplasmatales archaeon]
MDKINIALICNGYGRVMRGAEQFTYQFYNHMKDVLDIDIYGVGKTDHSIQIKSKFRDNFLLPWRNGRAYLESYQFGKAWYQSMIKSKKQYDLIFNNAGIGASYWCDKHRRMRETSFITRARGGGREEKINYLFKPDCMVFLTKENEVSTKRFLPKIKTLTIPNAIDLKEYNKKQEPPALLKGLERPIYLGTSAFVRYKRNDLIIKAASKLNNGSLLLLGDGPLKDKTVKLGKKLLGNRFRYGKVIPYFNREKMISLYQHADVFVQAARKEAFGVVFLEAMASNMPVVTQQDKRREEIIGDAGIRVADCNDINDFSQALYFASTEDWDKKPREQAKKYDWKAIKKQYIELIKEVASTVII